MGEDIGKEEEEETIAAEEALIRDSIARESKAGAKREANRRGEASVGQLENQNIAGKRAELLRTRRINSRAQISGFRPITVLKCSLSSWVYAAGSFSSITS